MRCHTAIKMLLICVGTLLSNDYVYCSQEIQKIDKQQRGVRGINKQQRGFKVVRDMVNESYNKDVTIVVDDEVKAALHQIIKSSREGKLDLTHLVTNDLLHKTMKQYPRVWKDLKCVFVGARVHSDKTLKDATLLDGVFNRFEMNGNVNLASEETKIDFFERLLEKSYVEKFEYPGKAYHEKDQNAKYLNEKDRVFIKLTLNKDTDLSDITKSHYDEPGVIVVVEHTELAKICMRLVGFDVPVDKYGGAVTALGEVGYQIGVVKSLEKENEELLKENGEMKEQVKKLKGDLDTIKWNLSKRIEENKEQKKVMQEHEAREKKMQKQLQEHEAREKKMQEQLQEHEAQENAMKSRINDLVSEMFGGVIFEKEGINGILKARNRKVEFGNVEGKNDFYIIGPDNAITLTNLWLHYDKERKEKNERQQMQNSAQHGNSQSPWQLNGDTSTSPTLGKFMSSQYQMMQNSAQHGNSQSPRQLNGDTSTSPTLGKFMSSQYQMMQNSAQHGNSQLPQQLNKVTNTASTRNNFMPNQFQTQNSVSPGHGYVPSQLNSVVNRGPVQGGNMLSHHQPQQNSVSQQRDITMSLPSGQNNNMLHNASQMPNSAQYGSSQLPQQLNKVTNTSSTRNNFMSNQYQMQNNVQYENSQLPQQLNKVTNTASTRNNFMPNQFQTQNSVSPGHGYVPSQLNSVVNRGPVQGGNMLSHHQPQQNSVSQRHDITMSVPSGQLNSSVNTSSIGQNNNMRQNTLTRSPMFQNTGYQQ